MNKKLIALAVAAGLTAPMAASAAPTVYGLLHMSFGTVNQDYAAAATTDTDNWQIRSHASRLGFKGAEELGNGMKAKYQIEYGINPVDKGTLTDSNGDTVSNASGLSGRNQWLGLAGNFGEVRLGTHDRPTKMAQGKFDLFGDTDADIKGKLSMSQAETRGEGILYISPKVAGALTIAAQVVPGEETGTGDVQDGIADQTSIAAMYGAGPLYISVGMDDYDATAASDELDSITRAVATYKMGAMQFGVLYEMGENAASSGSTGDKDIMGISFKFSMGKNAMKVQYMATEEDAGAGTADTEDTQISLGVDHAMSKNTTAYFMYTTAEHDEAGTGDYDYDFVGLGLKHKF